MCTDSCHNRAKLGSLPPLCIALSLQHPSQAWSDNDRACRPATHLPQHIESGAIPDAMVLQQLAQHLALSLHHFAQETLCSCMRSQAHPGAFCSAAMASLTIHTPPSMHVDILSVGALPPARRLASTQLNVCGACQCEKGFACAFQCHAYLHTCQPLCCHWHSNQTLASAGNVSSILLKAQASQSQSARSVSSHSGSGICAQTSCLQMLRQLLRQWPSCSALHVRLASLLVSTKPMLRRHK